MSKVPNEERSDADRHAAAPRRRRARWLFHVLRTAPLALIVALAVITAMMQAAPSSRRPRVLLDASATQLISHNDPTPSGADPLYPLNHTIDGKTESVGSPPANSGFEQAGGPVGTPPPNYGPPGALGVLREGREGKTFFTTDVYSRGWEAEQRLSLPQTPLYRVRFRIVTSGPVVGPQIVEAAFGQPGGGTEYWATVPPPVVVRVLEVFKLV